MDDAEFGRAFLRRAVTRARLEAALATLTTKRFTVGPLASGPIGLASVAAEGRLEPALVGEPDAERHAFPVTVPAVLDFAIKVGVTTRLRAHVRVDLTLTPRAAAPLLLVVDVAPVRAADVQITWHGSGLAGPVTSVLGAVTDELRGQVAKQVRSVLDGRGVRRARTFDVAARLAGERDAPLPDAFEWLDDATFSRRFLEHAVTRERVARGATAFAGQDIAIGPLRTGPRRAVTVDATGRLGSPSVTARAEGFDALLPLHLDLVVDLRRANRYAVEAEVPLRIVPRPAEPLAILLDIAPVEPSALRVAITPDGTLAGLLARVGNLDAQLRRQVARTVNNRLADPALRTIDVGARLDAMETRKRPRPAR